MPKIVKRDKKKIARGPGILNAIITFLPIIITFSYFVNGDRAYLTSTYGMFTIFAFVITFYIGIIYGLLTCLTDGYGFACYPFDYLIGFGSVAVMGFFRKQIFGEDQNGYNAKGIIFILIAATLTTTVRYIGSNVSSIVVYGLSLKGALTYNAFYIPLSGLISTLALIAMYGPLVQINRHFKVKEEKVEAQ